MRKRIGAVIALAAALGLGLSAPAMAAPSKGSGSSTTVYLNPGNVGSTANSMGGGGCADSGSDTWHFVAPGSKVDFTQVTAYFDADGDPSTIEATYTTTDFGPPSAKHAYLFTEPGLTLIGGVANVTGATTGFFVLSGACPATVPQG